VPKIRLHGLRHTHGTLLIKAGVTRLGNPAFAIGTYRTCSLENGSYPCLRKADHARGEEQNQPVEAPEEVSRLTTVEALANESFAME